MAISKAKHSQQEQHGPKKPFGFVLVLRGLASAAIRLDDRPGVLRVLCVVAEYMNQDGKCKISQDTVAARLGISRQAVNAHLGVLNGMGILLGNTSKDGVLKSYSLDTEGLEDERFGQVWVEERRAAKREAKKRKSDPDHVEPKIDPRMWKRAVRITQGDTVRHSKYGVGRVDIGYHGGPYADVQFRHGEHYVRISSLMIPDGPATDLEAPAKDGPGNNADAAAPTSAYASEPTPHPAPRPRAARQRPVAKNDRVRHPKFGVGTVSKYYCGGGLALVHFSSGDHYAEEKDLELAP